MALWKSPQREVDAKSGTYRRSICYWTFKNGAEAKSYTFTDMPGLLLHLEGVVRDMHIPDFDLKSKMQDQMENLGYIDLTTDKKEDRRKTYHFGSISTEEQGK